MHKGNSCLHLCYYIDILSTGSQFMYEALLGQKLLTLDLSKPILSGEFYLDVVGGHDYPWIV